MLIQAQGQYKLDSLQKELEQHPSLIEIENGKFTTVELYKEERVSIRENNRHFGEASDRKKEPNVLQLATSVLDNKSHGQHTDSYPQTEKFSLIEAVDRDSKMSQVVDTYLQQDDQKPSKTLLPIGESIDRAETAPLTCPGLTSRYFCSCLDYDAPTLLE